MAYYEICDGIKKDGWTVVQDPEGRIGPYAYKGNQWVSYDDAAMIKYKVRLFEVAIIEAVVTSKFLFPVGIHQEKGIRRRNDLGARSR